MDEETIRLTASTVFGSNKVSLTVRILCIGCKPETN